MGAKSKMLGVAVLVGAILLSGSHPVRAITQVRCSVIPATGLIVDVTQDVVNDADSGVHGYWAFDNYQRHIRVWHDNSQDSGSAYCARVDYDGTFDSWADAPSPEAGTILVNPIHGSMTGGRTATINGIFKQNPSWVTSGNVGKFDYQCDKKGICPGIVRWTDQYFSGEYAYNDTNWAWTYKSCGHGQWLNALSGNSGDIVNGPTDEVCATPTPTPTANPKAGKQSSAGIDGKVCNGQNFNAYTILKLDGNPVKDVNVKFVYNNEAKFAKTQADGRAGVAYGYVNDGDVQVTPDDGYPTQIQRANKASDCSAIVTATSVTPHGQVLGATTLAKTGSITDTLANLVGVLGAGIASIGAFFGFKKRK